MAALLQGVRCVSGLGPRYTQVRGVKRWMRPYLMMLERKKRLEKPPEPVPVPRYQQPHFDFHAEVLAFSKRLNESFSTELLKTAFVNHSYVVKEESERRELGVDKDLASLNLQDNRELVQQGLDFTTSYLTGTIQQGFPNLPIDGVKAYVDYLTSQQLLCHVAKNLGIDDLTLSAECPLSPETLQTTFCGVVGALLQSSGADRTSRFLQDFLIPELIGKDLFDVWSVRDPMSLLVAQLSQRNVPAPEPRLTRQSGASTVLPVYFVGLYCDKQLIAEGAGETVIAAEEEAARVALRKMFGVAENRRPWDYPTSRQGTGDSTVLQSVG